MTATEPTGNRSSTMTTNAQNQQKPSYSSPASNNVLEAARRRAQEVMKAGGRGNAKPSEVTLPPTPPPPPTTSTPPEPFRSPLGTPPSPTISPKVSATTAATPAADANITLPPIPTPATTTQTTTMTTTTSNAPTSSTTTVNVKFQVKYCAKPGDTLVVLGKHRSLGNWDSRAGVQMAWGAGDIWTGYVALPAGHVYDYKYALATPSSQMWEKGANRMLTVDIEDVEVGIEVIDRWEDASGSKLVTSSGVISSTGAKLAETLQKARKSVEDALAANRSLKAELAQKEVVNRVNQKEIKLALTRVSEAEKVAKDAKEQARQAEELAIERVEAAKEEARRELEDLAGTALKRAEDAETTSSDLSMKLTQAEQRALRAEEKEAELRETLMLKEKHMKEAGEHIRSLEVEKEGLEMEMLDGAERFREALQATRALFMTEKKVIKKSVGEALQATRDVIESEKVSESEEVSETDSGSRR